MAVPSAVKTRTTDNYVGTLDLHKEDRLDAFVYRYEDQTLTETMELLDLMETASQTKIEHDEEDWIMQNIRIESDVADQGAGSDIQITIASEYHDPQGNSFPQVGEVVQFKNDLSITGDITAKGGSSGAHTLTITPRDTTKTMGAVSAGDYVIIVSNRYEQGSGQPSGITPSKLHYENYTQIFKRSYEVTGSEMTNQIWDYIDTDGGGFLWYLKGENDTYRRHMKYIDGGILVGEKSDKTVNGNRATTTEGLLTFIRNYGNRLPYTAASGYNLSDLRKQIKKLNKLKAGKEHFYYVGIDLRFRINDFLADYMRSGGVTYGAFKGSKDLAVNLQFDSIQDGGHIFHLKTLDTLNDNQIFGSPGFKYPGLGFMIPAGKVKTSRGQFPYFGLRPKGTEGYNRWMEHWLTGSAGLDRPTNETDELKCHYRTEVATEGFAGNKFYLTEEL